MSFEHSDFSDDEFYNDEFDQASGADDLGKFFDLGKFLINCDFNPNDKTVLIFNVEMSRPVLQLALALLNNAGSVEACEHILRAAWALRKLTGAPVIQESDDAVIWNRQHSVGQLVRYWPEGRNGESYLSYTTSPAFDTAGGPVLLVDDHEDAVSLLNVEASSVRCPEVAP